jgi:hypothetical protein
MWSVTPSHQQAVDAQTYGRWSKTWRLNMSTFITAFGHGKNVGVIASDLCPRPDGTHAIGPTLLTAGQSRSEECRKQAVECLEIADHWSDLVKDQYEELARQWLMLAKRADRPF